MRSHLVVLVLCTLTLSRCQSSSTTNYPDEKIGRVFSIDTMGSAYSVRLFPKTYSATLSRSFSLVLVSPVLVKDEILYNSTSSSLIPWFNSRGVSVWLVKIPAHTRLDYFGTAVLPQIASSIQQNSTEENWVMGGVSLGGQAIAHYLQKADENATATGMRVDAVFFLGTGFDYAYPSSFARVLKDQLKSDDFCALKISVADTFRSLRPALPPSDPIFLTMPANLSGVKPSTDPDCVEKRCGFFLFRAKLITLRPQNRFTNSTRKWWGCLRTHPTIGSCKRVA